MSDAPVWRTLAELGWNPPAIEPEADPISWRLPVSALRERCETCGGSRCVVPPDCDCDVVTSLNFALCPHPPDECPDCRLEGDAR